MDILMVVSHIFLVLCTVYTLFLLAQENWIWIVLIILIVGGAMFKSSRAHAWSAAPDGSYVSGDSWEATPDGKYVSAE